MPAVALASGPRYVTGPPFFTAPAGQPIGWKQSGLTYFTDPGDLSPSVSNAAANALVAASAAVWNVPVANITLSSGGSLAEHVSGQNTYLGTNGVVFPSDVMASNSSAISVAVIYDTDGSVTDTLLGVGASQPSSCRQNAVTESVDGFDPAGYITHAIIILNGLCTAAAPSAQLEMQYKLERIFGRVLGLAWSQTNDNVFTGTPTPTYNQALNWPIMHPIDILCGPYAYQCLPNPFQLRPDDISGLVTLYPVPAGNTPAGKQASLTAALGAEGHVTFPTGEGMEGVNVLIRRAAANEPADTWFENSAVTGATFRRAARSPFVLIDTTASGSLGSTDASLAGFYSVAYIPVETVGDTPWQNLSFSTEPVNSLYSGTYSLGPYTLGTVNPSGSAPAPVGTFVDGPGAEQPQDFAIRDAAGTCGSGADGTASSPAEVAASGWWTGLLCGYGHTSYGTVNVHPNRSFTIEVTALDEQGAATETKAMPVIGLFAPTDAPGDLPSLGVTPAAFNSLTFATTSIHANTGQLTSLSFGIADERGDGRPDFAYQGRLFYADTVSPSTIATSGATLTLSGFGYRSGNAVTVNGVTATVISSTANTIVLTAPTLSSARATDGTPVNITVTDLGTGASTTMFGALTYHAGPALPNSMRVVSAPVGSGYVGDATPVPFAVQVVAADGVTPVTGDPVTFSAASGSAGLGACSAPGVPCTVLTDSTGMAATKVTPLQPGAVTLRAADATLSQSATFNATAQAGSILVFAAPSGNLPVGILAQPYFFVRVFNAQGNLIPGAPVTFSAPTGSVTFSGCFTSTCTVIADSSATAFIFVTPTAPGPVTLEAVSGDRHQQVSFTAVANTDTMQTHVLPRATAFVNESAGQFQVQLLHGDGSPDSLESLTFTASAGTTIDQCGTSSCSLTTDGSGLATISLTPHQLGTATVQATYGTLTQSANFTVTQHTLQLNVLSAPSGSFPVGATVPTPFTTQLLQDGTPIAGVQMVLAVPPDAGVLTACNGGSCVLTTDGNGTVSTLVTPIAAGTITLSAAYPSISTTASFVSIGQPETMRVINQPPATGENVGDIEMFTVQLVGPDGSTPLAWHDVAYTVTGGPFAFISCRYAVCTGVTDSTGVVNVWGMVTGAGAVSVQAAADGLSQTMTFTSSAAPDILHLVTAPASGSYASSPAAVPFAVQLLFGDGVSFAASKNVTLSVGNGSATFAACGGASTCTVQTDATGIVSTSVTPLAAGSITVSAAEAGVTPSASQSATFSALPALDQFQLISVPGSGSLVGTPAGTPFASQLRVGGNPAPSRSVSLSLSSGSASFAACGGASSCTVQTDASGRISTLVTPLAAGTITLVVSEIGATPAVSQAATFTAFVPSDVLQLTSAPTSGGLPGVTASAPFAVQLLQPNGLTAMVNRAVLLSVGSGSAALGACGGGTSCTVQTDASGTVSTLVTPMASGTVSLVATEVGATPAVSQSATFTVSALPDTMRLLSGPASGGYPGSPESTPFSVQILLGSGAVASNKSVTLSVLSGSASFAACSGGATCVVQADASGTMTTLVTPLTSGSVTLLAAETDNPSFVNQRATFTVAALSDVLHLVSTPGANNVVGAPAATPFAVQLLLADGVTPIQNRSIAISVSSGSAAFTACGGNASCTVQTDAFGVISTPVTPLSTGTVTLVAVESGVSTPAAQSATFFAVAAPNLLRVVSAPASGGYSGLAAPTPFVLQVLLPDGSTPVPNQNVTIAVSSGSASFTACAGASTCTLRTDSLGNVSTTVTPLAAGTITLSGSIPGASTAITQTASFTARPPQDVLAVTSTPGASVYTGASASAPLTLRLTLADGITPVAGSPITVSSSGAGAVSFTACNEASCTLNTGADGTISTLVQGTVVGDVTFTATPASTTGAQAATLAFEVLANHFALTATPGQTWIAEGATVSLALNAAATVNGNAAAAETLQWVGTAGLAPGMASSVTGATGTSSMWASAGPLAAGASSTATVCGRASLCQSFTATGVSSRDFALSVVSGGVQAAQGGASLQPVTIVVTDASGHPVASAAVTVSQTVTALNQPCPTHGRCPAAPVLNSQISTIVSSLDGTVTLTPLSISGTATKTELAFSSGTQGFVTAVVSSNP